LKSKIPEMETSLALVRNLQKKRDEKETVMTRYSLADDVYGKAELDLEQGSVNLWLGANVMLEYTYEDAIEFLSKNEQLARTEFIEVKNDLAFVRDQIVTSEVSMTRIFNWDVRKKRTEKTETGGDAKK
jgi:prefoldin subunit 5